MSTVPRATAEGQEQEFLLSVFLVDAWDCLATLEEGVRAGVPAPDALLVVAHRLKGTAALYGFPGISTLAGAVELAVERVASGPMEARDATLAALGEMMAFLQGVLDGVVSSGREDGAAIAAFTRASAPFVPPPAPVLGLAPDVLEYFRPEAAEHLEAMTRSLLSLERHGRDAEQIRHLFRAVHTLKGAAYTVGAKAVGDLAHTMEDRLMPVREADAPLTAALIEGLFAGIDALNALLGLGGDARALLEIARARLDVVAPSQEPADAPAEAAPAERAATTAPAPVDHRERPSIRVRLDHLDALMDLVGELVTSRSRLDRRLGQLAQVGDLLLASRARMTHAVQRFEAKHAYSPLAPDTGSAGPAVPFHDLELDRYDDFNILARSVAEISNDVTEVQGQLATLVRAVGEDTAQVQRLTGALRTEVARARMVPIGRLFARFTRQVRDLARSEGKTVTLEVSGETVEVDNRIIEQIADPLLHLVRNAVAHGLESEADRLACGKPPVGTVSLRAALRGASVSVEVADDGRGIDARALPARAVARGLMTEEAAARLSEPDALDLIFLPGFSTAAAVTEVAGRGVGMDVVRTNVSRLNGEIDIDTTLGAGTRFTLRLPLTVTIMDALMVRAGTATFALPVSAVKMVLEVRPEDAGDIITVAGEQLPFVDLAETLGLPHRAHGRRLPVVVVRAGRTSFALAVDALSGKEEIVTKPFDAFLEGEAPFAAATIAADGRVVLVLDSARLFDQSRGLGAPAAVAPRPAAPLAEKTPHILLVDDSVSVRKFVGQMLERAGLRVTAACDGEEALAALADISVDCVVTDLEMPRLNGYELIHDLRNRPATRDVPIVVVTTRAGARHADLARELGVQRYVTKPVDAEHFVPLVEALVHGQAAAH